MRYYTKIGDREWEFAFERRGGELFACCGDHSWRLDLSMIGDGRAFSLLVDGHSHDLLVTTAGGVTQVQLRGELLKVAVQDERERTASAVAGHKADGRQQICAVMPGVVVDVACQEGEVVEGGQTLLVLEAMKMQNPITAEAPGEVHKVHARKGEAVAGGALLVEILPVKG
ncbi:MAG: acyl-CoA carboxylase biotin carboxyl carrier protein subunit [Planctomycetota bacterium]|jgi:geranyl-CoA carboxylase alpha subunit